MPASLLQFNAGATVSALSAVLQALPFPAFVKGRDGRYLECNARFLEWVGLPAERVIGKTVREVTTPGLAEAYERDDRALFEFGKPMVFENESVRADGQRRVIQHHKSPIVDERGLVTGLACVIIDVTENQRTEKLYRQMFETNAAVKLLIDPESGRIEDANAAAERFYGWSREALTSMRITDLNILPAAQVTEEMARARGEDRLFFRFRHRVASGELRDVEVYSGPVTHHGRELLHSIITDVTDRNRYQRELELKTAQLERSNADLEQFAYVASHDLQEPLRTVTSYLQLLERRYRDQLDGDANDFIGFTVQAAKRMGQMIQALLEYSRVDSQAHAFELVDLNEVLEVVLANLHYAIEEAGADVRVNALPMVRGDEAQLTSLFQNLVGNALKYRHAGRRPVVDVSARVSGGGWEISVCDNGIGIAPSHHEQIFLVFKRLHGAGQYEGTGIGLAVCKRIVVRHGGRIWVESRENDGATFRFTLPAVEPLAALSPTR